jgi:hypothetical protein
MDSAILLYVATIFNDNLAPVASNGSTRADVYIFPDNYIPRYGCIRVDERRFVNDRPVTIEFKNV